PTRAQADPGGAGADGGQQHRRGAAGDARHRVVLSHPEPLITMLLGGAGPLERMRQSRGLRVSPARAGAVERGEPHAVVNAGISPSLPGWEVENLSSPPDPGTIVHR